MCLSTVYQVKNGQAEPVISQVSAAEVHDGSVTFTDILGTTTDVEGVITSVDLIDNKIYVAA